MAVIKGINGLEVTVEVDRVPATEYGPWDDEDTHPPGDMEFHIPKTGQLDGRPYVVKYIESKPGKTFRFRVKRAGEFRHRSHHIGYKFGIDAIVSGCIHDYTEDKRTPWDSTNGSIMSGDIKRGYTAFEACFAELDIGKNSSTFSAVRQVPAYLTFGVCRKRMQPSARGVETPAHSCG